MNKIIFILSGFVLLFSACSNRASFDEQYKKILYIVNSKEGLHYAQHEASENSRGTISMYCTGSELPDENVYVSYKIDKEALAAFNQNEYGDNTALYFTPIPDNAITLENDEVVIKKGEEYGCLNFTVNTRLLAPDCLHVLPVTISAVPEGYEISEEMHTIFYIVNVQNEFAGDYISNYKQDGVAKGDISKTALAMAARQILLPLANKSNATAVNFNMDYYLVTIQSDNTLVLTPYLQSFIRQNPDEVSYYDPENRIFYIHYFLEDQYENPIRIDETMSGI